MCTTYVQYESLKKVTLFFEQAALVAQTWIQTVNNLANLKTKYNSNNYLLKDINNQLHAHCLEPINNKQALQNWDKELATIKAHILKQ
jgi:hypothetical protein